jgi:hypothetical protein
VLTVGCFIADLAVTFRTEGPGHVGETKEAIEFIFCQAPARVASRRFYCIENLTILRYVVSCWPRFRWRTQMDEQRKYAILLAATILAARKLNEIGVKSCPARECAIADAITNAEQILKRIDERWPTETLRLASFTQGRKKCGRNES